MDGISGPEQKGDAIDQKLAELKAQRDQAPASEPGLTPIDVKPVSETNGPEAAVSAQPGPPPKASLLRPLGLVLIVLSLLAAGFFVFTRFGTKPSAGAQLDASSKYPLQPALSPALTAKLGSSGSSGTLTVNGAVSVTGSLILNPSVQPVGAVAGELYYDQAKNLLGYYNGTTFIYPQGGGSVTNNITNNSITNNVTNVSAGGLAGTGTAGSVAMFTGPATLGDSMINQSGSNLNTGSGVQAVTIGSQTGSSSAALQGGTGGIALTTGPESGASGGIDIASGASSTTASGNVTIDTGPSIITGTLVGTDNFETGLDSFIDGFGFHDTLAQSSAQAHSGSDSLAVTQGLGPVGNQWEIVNTDPYAGLPVTPGHKYYFSAWVRAGSNSSTIIADAIFDSNSFGGTGSPNTYSWGTITDVATGWKQVSGDLTAPAGMNFVSLEFMSTVSGSAGDVHYLDDISVIDLTSSTAIASLNLGAANAQAVTLGNLNEISPTSIFGGGVTINGGQSNIDISGGALSETAQLSTYTTTAGALNITAASSSTWQIGNYGGNGGSLVIKTGDGNGCNCNGGDLTLQAGASSGTGISGSVGIDSSTGNVSGTIVDTRNFETGTDNMLATGATVAQSNAAAFTGSYSLARTAAGGPWTVTQDQTQAGIPVTAGNTYYFSAHVRSQASAETVAGFITWLGHGTLALNTVTETTTGWYVLSGVGTAPAGTAEAYWNFSGNATAGLVQFMDDFTVTDLSGSTGTSAVNVGTYAAQSVNVGNQAEVGPTSIQGGAGVNISSFANQLNLSGDNVVVKPQDNTTATFQVQDAAGADLINIATNSPTLINDNYTTSAPTGTFVRGSSWVSGQYVELNNGGPGNDGEVNYQLANVGNSFNASFDFWSKTGGGDGTFFYAFDHRTPATFHLGTYYGGGGYIFSYGDTIEGADAGIYYDGTLVASAPIPAPDNSTWHTAQIVKAGSTMTMYLDGSQVLAYTDPIVRDLSGTNFGVGGCSCSNAGEHRATNFVLSGDQYVTTGGSAELGGNIDIPGTLTSGAIETNQLTSSGSLIFKPWNDSTSAFEIQNAYDTPLLTADTANMTITVQALVDTTTLTVDGHIISGGSTPSFSEPAATVCSGGGNVGVTGNDTSGVVSITTGTAPCSLSGPIINVTFASSYTTAPHVILTPAEPNASTLQYYVTTSTTGFTVDTNSANLVGATTYNYNYLIVQ